MTTRRRTRGSAPTWEITLQPVEQTGRVRRYLLDFTCTPPGNAPTTSTAPPQTITIRADLTDELDARVTASRRTRIGPVFADVWRKLIREYQGIVEILAPSLPATATEATIRDQVRSACSPPGARHWPY